MFFITSVTLPSSFANAPPQESRAPLAALLPNADPAFLTLRMAVKADAPDLQVALARVDAARAALRAAGAARSPNIDARASAAYAHSSENAVTNLPPGFGFDPENSNFSAGIMHHETSTCSVGFGQRNAQQALGRMPPTPMPERSGWRSSPTLRGASSTIAQRRPSCGSLRMTLRLPKHWRS